jgi:hypothetical protein
MVLIRITPHKLRLMRVNLGYPATTVKHLAGFKP